MRGMCRVTLVGRLGADPELRTSAGGQHWCVLSVATNRAERQGEEWVEKTDWHRVKVFGDLAELCHRRLRTGSLLGAEGDLQYERWSDGEGRPRFHVSILARRVDFIGDLKPREEAAAAAT